VVWSHEHFNRNKRDEVKLMKRTKKAKIKAKPAANVRISNGARSPSPSLSEVESASTSTPSTAAEGILRKFSGEPGVSWMESEFAYLRNQNQLLEQKMDVLLRITVSLSPPVSLEEIRPGEKRRRIDAPQDDGYYQHDSQHLASTQEEKKLGTIEPEQYQPGEKALSAHAHDYELGSTGERRTSQTDSLKAFVDIMLQDEEGEEKVDHEAVEEGFLRLGGESHYLPENDDRSAEVIPNVTTNDTLDDGLMEDAMDAIDDLNDSLCSVVEDDLPNSRTQPVVTTMANASVDKTDGPAPIRIVSSDAELGRVYSDGADIEEGNNICEGPIEVTVVTAEAELVEVTGGGISPEQLTRILDQFPDQRPRRKFFLAAVLVLLVVVVAIVAVVVTRGNEREALVIITKKGFKQKRPDGKPRRCNDGERSGIINKCVGKRFYDKHYKHTNREDEEKSDKVWNSKDYEWYEKKDDEDQEKDYESGEKDYEFDEKHEDDKDPVQSENITEDEGEDDQDPSNATAHEEIDDQDPSGSKSDETDSTAEEQMDGDTLGSTFDELLTDLQSEETLNVTTIARSSFNQVPGDDNYLTRKRNTGFFGDRKAAQGQGSVSISIAGSEFSCTRTLS